MNEMNKLYMHIHTGSVDTKDGWIDENNEQCTEKEINRSIKDGDLIEVVENSEDDKDYDEEYGDYRPVN